MEQKDRQTIGDRRQTTLRRNG